MVQKKGDLLKFKLINTTKMKKTITTSALALSLFLLMGLGNVFAQDKLGSDPDKCRTNLSIFYEYAKVKNYDAAYEPWKWCLDNCPASNISIYSQGIKIAEDRYEKASAGEKAAAGKLIDQVYENRIKYFPQNLGKVYSDWASSVEERGGSKEDVFKKLDAAFNSDPADMSVRNLATYFQEVTDRNKDNNVQKVFDTYDDVMETVNVKIGDLSKELDKLNAIDSTGAKLSAKDKRTWKNNQINLKALSQVEVVLDQIVSEVATCERLIPLYEKNFDSKQDDGKWLRRAASRLNEKECTDAPIFEKLVQQYAKVEPSPEASILVASILEKKGKVTEANKYRKEAVDLEKDPYKKAKYLFDIGYTYRRSSPQTAASYARQALQYQPSMGRAYLLIASAYAASANSCGTDEFSKRMVYVAAANKAAQAKRVDPSISSTADKYVSSYMANAPSKKDVFIKGIPSGTPYKIGCWINEMVKVP